MRILFVNPYIYDFTAYDLWLRPLGLFYLAAVAKHFTDSQIYWLDLLDRFQGRMSTVSRSDGRGKFAMTYWIDGVHDTLSRIKDRFPKAKIAVGGLIPTLMPEEVKNLLQADYYVNGHGEQVLLNIIAENGGHVGSHPDLSDVNLIPWPAFELGGNQRVLPILTSRGCPFSCSYCATQLLNPRFVQREPKRVVAELLFLRQSFQTEHFVFFDDALLLNKREHFFKIFHEIQKYIQVKFHTPNGLHVGEIDRETADVLYKSSFSTIRLSFESLNPELLKRSSNKVNASQMTRAVVALEQAGFLRKNLEAYLLFGYPGQMVKDIEEALFFVRDLGIVPRLAFFSPVPGTDDFILLQRKKILSFPVDPKESNKLFFLYEKSGLSPQEIDHVTKLTAQITFSVRSN